MEKKISKTFRVDAAPLQEFLGWVERYNEHDSLSEGDALGVVLQLFNKQRELGKLDLVQKFKAVHMKNARAAMLPLGPNGGAAARELDAAAERAEQGREGKQSKRRSV